MASDYFFDLIECSEIRAEEALECAGPGEAHDLAVQYARDIAADQVRHGLLHLHHAIVVRDESGEVIDTVRFGDAVLVD